MPLLGVPNGPDSCPWRSPAPARAGRGSAAPAGAERGLKGRQRASVRRLAAKAAGRKHLRRAPANCLQMRAHVLLGTPAVAEAPLRSGATTLAADRSAPAGFLAFRALARSRFPAPHRWLGGKELPSTCLEGEAGAARPHGGAAKQLPGAINPLGMGARCPRASVSPWGWAAPCHGDAGLCSAPRGARGHPRGGSGPGRVPQHTAGSRPGTNPYLPPWGARPAPAVPAAWSQACPRPAPPAPPVPARRAP